MPVLQLNFSEPGFSSFNGLFLLSELTGSVGRVIFLVSGLRIGLVGVSSGSFKSVSWGCGTHGCEGSWAGCVGAFWGGFQLVN